MRPRYLVIEGNIGTGKTTLAKHIASHYNFSVILEEFAENTFLPQFYLNPEQFAFPLEMSFMAARFKQLKDFFEKNTLPFPIVSDYMFEKSLLFAKVNLRKVEYSLLAQFFNLLKSSVPPPQLIVYLHKEVNVLQKNIKKRGRDYEQKIEDLYLQKINKSYRNYLKKQRQSKVLDIDTSHLDFVSNKKHMNLLLEKINSAAPELL